MAMCFVLGCDEGFLVTIELVAHRQEYQDLYAGDGRGPAQPPAVSRESQGGRIE